MCLHSWFQRFQCLSLQPHCISLLSSFILFRPPFQSLRSEEEEAYEMSSRAEKKKKKFNWFLPKLIEWLEISKDTCWTKGSKKTDQSQFRYQEKFFYVKKKGFIRVSVENWNIYNPYIIQWHSPEKDCLWNKHIFKYKMKCLPNIFSQCLTVFQGQV